MEENIHKDKMEEFLKHAFEDYSEDPPGDLWAKIDGAMGSTPTPPSPKVISFRPWWIAAAAAIVTGVFLFQHFYFTRQIENLGRELSKNSTELPQLEGENTVLPGNPVASSTEIIVSVEDANKATLQSEKLTNKIDNQLVIDKTPNNSTNQKLSDAVLPQVKNAGSNANTNKEKDTSLPPVQAVKGYEENKPMPNQKAIATGTNKENEPSNESPEGVPAGAEEHKSMNTITAISYPAILAMKTSLVQNKVEASFPNVRWMDLAPKIIPAKKHAYSAGVQAMSMLSREKITAMRRFSPMMNKVFDDQKETTGQTFMAGMAIEKKVANQFYIGSGINYRSTTFSSSHQPVLEFKDRHQHQGPPHGGPGRHLHDFDYILNTSAGAVAIEVRAESSDSTLQIPEDEKIGLEIKTRQNLQYLSIPLYAGYRFGKSKLGLSLKAGLMANILLGKSFEISHIASTNPHFRFSKSPEQRGFQRSLKNVSFDYMASAGLDYAVTNELSLRLEPTITGTLTSIQNASHISSSQFSAGVNVGLMYSF